MRIVLNANVTPSSATGVGQYIEKLIPALQVVEPNLQIMLLVDEQQPDLLCLPAGSRIALPFRPDQSFRHIPYQPFVMRQIKKARADLYHLPNTSPLMYTVCPTVVTIHDVQEFYVQKYGRARSAYRRVVNTITARVANSVITDSEHSKKTIVEHLHVPERKVHAIPLGRDERFKPSTDAEVEIPSPYIITVGQLQPGKNYLRLLEAFVRANVKDHKLVVVGSKGWGYAPLFERAEQADLKGRAVFLHGTSTEDLVALYNRADLCVLPSLYEGFGLPALEAMACSTPIIAANNSSFPEVLGNAGIYFDPLDIDEMAFTISKVLGDSALRRKMRESGLMRAQSFTWEKTAQATLDVYRSVL